MSEKESTWPCKNCGKPMKLKHYKTDMLNNAAKYFYKCYACGQRLLIKEIWLEHKR